MTSSKIINAAHNIPAVNTFQLNFTYIEGLIIFPGVLLVLCIIYLTAFKCCLCCRKRCTFTKNHTYLSTLDKRTRYAIIIFYVSLFLALLAVCLSWLGNSYLTGSWESIASDIGTYGTELSTISTSGTHLETYMNTINNNYVSNTNSPCSNAFASQTNNFKTDFIINTTASATGGQTLATDVGDLPNQLNNLQKSITTYIPSYHIAFNTLFAITLSFIILLSISYYIKNKRYLTCIIIFVVFIILAITIINTIVMIILVSGILLHI